MKCPFDQQLKPLDITGFKRNKPVLKAVNSRYKYKSLVKMYLILCDINGRLHTDSLMAFRLILASKPLDSELHKVYELGVKDGAKMNNHIYFKTAKETAAYESGRYFGRNNI